MTSIRELNQDEQTHLGLGLYIVKLIADFHQGSARAENINSYKNKPFKGVKFTIELPIHKA